MWFIDFYCLPFSPNLSDSYYSKVIMVCKIHLSVTLCYYLTSRSTGRIDSPKPIDCKALIDGWG